MSVHDALESLDSISRNNHDQGLPILEHQKVELHKATADLDRVRLHIPVDGERGFQRIVNADSSRT